VTGQGALDLRDTLYRTLNEVAIPTRT